MSKLSFEAFLALSSSPSSSVTVEEENNALLEATGLKSAFEETVEQEEALQGMKAQAQEELQDYAAFEGMAVKAAKLLEAKVSAVENLLQEMETAGLLPEQLAATKQRHVENAAAAVEAAKLHKQRLNKLLGDKKLK